MAFKYETYGKRPLGVLLPWALPMPKRPAKVRPAKPLLFLLQRWAMRSRGKY